MALKLSQDYGRRDKESPKQTNEKTTIYAKIKNTHRVE